MQTAKKIHYEAAVLSNECIASGVFCMSLAGADIANAAIPGQFVHVRVSSYPVQFLRMPFAIFETDSRKGCFSICYQVLGEGTEQLSKLATDDTLDVIGPIGNGWNPPDDCSRALLVAGGLGAPALNLLASTLAHQGACVDVVMGALTAEKLVCHEQLENSVILSGGRIFITTDDGTLGTKGFVTSESDALLASGAYDYLAVCGPDPMERNTVKPALGLAMRSEVSMERLMACGVGVCLSCVVDTVKGKKRCCVDGPVFDAKEVVW